MEQKENLENVHRVKNNYFSQLKIEKIDNAIMCLLLAFFSFQLF
jgi:hypothetical protein